MSIIELKDIKLYAYHGCLHEEEKIGQEYILDVAIQTDFSKGSEKDELSETIDYCEVYELVKKEMEVRSKLIESVGMRISMEIKKRWKNIETVEVTVKKPKPPIHGDVGEVSITVTA